VVRNSSKLKSNIAPEWIDASLWERTKPNDSAIRQLIGRALQNTTVTVVLIGSDTSKRRWVNYEIRESLARGNALIGIYIHNIPGFNRTTDPKGVNPLPSSAPTYDWVRDDGYANLGSWVDRAYLLR
jgi:hypothetical protein